MYLALALPYRPEYQPQVPTAHRLERSFILPAIAMESSFASSCKPQQMSFAFLPLVGLRGCLASAHLISLFRFVSFLFFFVLSPVLSAVIK